ncbi:MAG: acylneuraminate cytidylyltransferase family protein [Proteobacteria bacterium]|nr:acylneuraminate cytidylyltransferase family protein [Pseudomonadota bacterium]
MIDGNKILAVITARGGSKGLPGKNISDVGGKPLIAWTIEAAQGSNLIDRTVLSSDDDAIIAAAKSFGCEAPFVRPAELAADASPSADALIHALDQMAETYDYLVLLQPTSPLRVTEDIDGAIEKCHVAGASACVTGCEPAKSPYWMFHLGDGDAMTPVIESESPITRRQDLPKVFAPNGAVFVTQVPWFRDNRTFYGPGTVAYAMPQERSIDIDNALDLTIVRTLLEIPADEAGKNPPDCRLLKKL